MWHFNELDYYEHCALSAIIYKEDRHTALLISKTIEVASL